MRISSDLLTYDVVVYLIFKFRIFYTNPAASFTHSLVLSLSLFSSIFICFLRFVYYHLFDIELTSALLRSRSRFLVHSFYFAAFIFN